MSVYSATTCKSRRQIRMTKKWNLRIRHFMAAFKQDMPPPGGYAPITFSRVPLKSGLSLKMKCLICFGVTTAGYFIYHAEKDRIVNDRIELRCARLAVTPMLEAERDRMFFKQLKRNRDAEERIMKDVKGWEVGKWRHSPVYLTLKPDEYFPPTAAEYFAHAEYERQMRSYHVLR